MARARRIVLTRSLAPEFLENVEAIEVRANMDFDDGGWFVLSALIAGAGFGVDTLTGALFEQQPSDVFVSLPVHDGEIKEELEQRRRP